MTNNWLPLGGVALLLQLFVVFALYSSYPACNSSTASGASPSLRRPGVENISGSIADGCRYIYFDVGSNIGVQVRKLFQPELYPGAKILPHFEQYFGSPEFRRRNDSGVCAIGFEANPSHSKRLKRLEKCYQEMGWRVHFFAPGVPTKIATSNAIANIVSTVNFVTGLCYCHHRHFRHCQICYFLRFSPIKSNGTILGQAAGAIDGYISFFSDDAQKNEVWATCYMRKISFKN
jgi:hypothetical protein